MAESIILIEIIDLFDWEPLKKNSRAQIVMQDMTLEEANRITEEFAYYILNFYKALILNAIKTQKFPAKYPPLSKAHLDRKKKHGWKLGFWEMTGFLQRNLTIWKYYKNNYAIGFKEGIVHPESGTPILIIAKTLEKGSVKRGIPARPLFSPLAAGLSRHIYDVHFLKFMREKHPDIYEHMWD